MRIGELPKLEKPREKALHFGISSLSNAELLSVIICTGNRNKSAIELSYELLNYFEGLSNISNASFDSLLKVKGIGIAKAISLLAVSELAKRISLESQILAPIRGCQDVFDLFSPILSDELQERCLIVLLNTKNCVIKYVEIAKGSVANHNIHIRDVFRDAIKENSSRIIMIHNHPSGDCIPSKEDIQTTIDIANAGKIIGITLIDHIVIAKNSYYSLKSNELF